MGLIKAALGSVGSTLHDQFKEAIRCEDMGNEILMVRKSTENGVISSGSTIIVAPGQCAVIYDNGKVLDATAEEGVYTFDSSSTPSFFAGQFGAVFKEMWQRFTYGGASAKEQAVLFFNIKEIMDNKFGTPAPIPYQDWSHPIPNQMTGTLTPLRLEVKCFGKYTFKITDPAVFLREISGLASVYKKEMLTEQIRSEVISAFQNILNELGTEKYKIPVMELPSQTDEIKEIMDQNVYDSAIRRRGISIVTFNVESVTLDDESEKKIDNYELGSNAYMQQGRMTDAYAKAMEGAANNSNGAANGFMGLGMMNMASGGVMNGMNNNIWQNTGNSSIKNNENGEEKECPKCKKKIDKNAKFCPECGEKIEE